MRNISACSDRSACGCVRLQQRHLELDARLRAVLDGGDRGRQEVDRAQDLGLVDPLGLRLQAIGVLGGDRERVGHLAERLHHEQVAQVQAERFSQGEILRAIDFLAAAIAAVKDGSEPRIQLEMALLKATQPQADLSLQALMFRIEQLEARLGGVARRAAPPARHPRRRRRRPRRPRLARRRRRAGGRGRGRARGGGGAGRRSGAVELEQLQAVWPAVGEAVTEENAMLGAALGAARPVALEGERLTVAFPPDAAFVKKKAEANRDVVQRVLRGLTGHSLVIAYELREDAARRAAAARRGRADRASAGGVRRRRGLRGRGAARDGRTAEHERDAQAGPEDAGRDGQGPGGAQERGRRGQRRRRHGHREGHRRPRAAGARIDPEAVDPEDVELLQDMVLAAVNEARALRPGAGRDQDERGRRRPRRAGRPRRARPARASRLSALCSPRPSTG